MVPPAQPKPRSRHIPYCSPFREPKRSVLPEPWRDADVVMSLGIILALNHLYDNWTIAGVMSAAYVLSTAAVTPLYARLFDRFGQRKVGSVVLVVQNLAMLGFAFAALVRVPIPLLFACCG